MVFYSAVVFCYPQDLEPLSAHTPAAQPSLYPLAWVSTLHHDELCPLKALVCVFKHLGFQEPWIISLELKLNTSQKTKKKQMIPTA